MTAGLQPDAQGRLPAGMAMRRAAEDARVIRLLSPLPVATAAKRTSSPAAASGAAKKPKAKAKPQQQRVAPLPEGLQGTSTTPDGTAICFAYNEKRCSQQGRG
eukprot:5619573-Amphidinium_carterae.1